ncbi:Mitochondrial import inner membrane translocase subunit [Trema orientale]|uniref:Mitochondrial import inner membrane translocase subunit n=1 Tax=Trema orientale TaxID=63057 RepID=A0A2P5D7V9_TREOI|nr:Mitochondrial import inner membrane translocase subunit [Trema orientale]
MGTGTDSFEDVSTEIAPLTKSQRDHERKCSANRPPLRVMLTHTCFNKCVEKKYKESELNMGENSCIDRCVSKYWHVTNLVGQLLGSGRPPM